MLPRSQIWLLLALALAGALAAVSGRVDPYFLDVAMGVGINLIDRKSVV